MTKKLLLSIFLMITSILSGLSQSPDNRYFLQPSILDSANNQKIIFRIENINFLRNLEYFNPIAEGHTFLGYIIRPSVIYQPTANTSLQLGIHLLKYSGNKNFAQALPFFRFQYRARPELDIVMGSLYSTLNHGMIEPMYGSDRYIEENAENGIQFLYHAKHYRGDLWLNWQNFIRFNDNQKEQFSLGYTSELILTDKSKPTKIALPIQFLFAHKGGQNTLDTTSMITRFNGAIGLSVEQKLDHKFVKSLGGYGYYLVYRDLVSPHIIAYSQGNGKYVNVYLNTSFINFTAGYWHGFQFFNPRGERLFSNISTIYDHDRLGVPVPGQYRTQNRSLLLSKVFIHHDISKAICLAASFESFYDYKNSINDYNYTLCLICNLDFFIHKLKLIN